MSCLDKLKNNPVAASFDKAIQGIIPSSLQDLTTGQKKLAIKDSLKSVAGDIKKNITNQVNNIIGQITGKFDATFNQVKNLKNVFSSLPSAFKNAFNNAAKAFSTQLKNVKDLIKCEVTSTIDSVSTLYENCILQSTITAAAVGSTAAVSNNLIKSFSENPVAKDLYINSITDSTITKASAAALAAKTNKIIVIEQTSVLNKLQALA